MTYFLKKARNIDNRVDGPSTDRLTYRFTLNQDNLEYIVRTLYEFQDVPYWRDLEIKTMEARIVLNGHFFAVQNLSQEQLFTLIYDLYSAIINDNEEARDRFMSSLSNNDFYTDAKFSVDDLENGFNNSEISFSIPVANPHHNKDISARLDQDYDDIEDGKVSLKGLAPLREIDDIQREEEPFARHAERRKRAEHRDMEAFEEDIDPLRNMEHEYDVELRNRNILRMASDLESNNPNTSDYFRRGEGIIRRKKDIIKKLSSFFVIQPWI